MALSKNEYDICIIGAGPAGLATLSAIQEPYSMDSMNDTLMNKANQFIGAKNRRSSDGPRSKKVCVVDPHQEWLDGWKQNFASLGIDFLRSPAMAHPDHFDQNSLLAYAIANNREDELIESGCFDNKSLLSLGQTQIGLWKLPSTKLFQDFCQDLSKKLSHDYVQSTVHDIAREEDDDPFVITLADGSNITSNAVVLALGTTGEPVLPPLLKDVPKEKIFSWKNMKHDLQPNHDNVLVVGGGLTAVQTAQYALRQGKNVVLCSRRDLVNRHFDINTQWFDVRYANKLISEFYHEEESVRLSLLRQARGGGSVPPLYINNLKRWEKNGKLTNVTADAEFIKMTEQDKIVVSFVGSTRKREKLSTFDCVILACGVKPDCTANPLVQKIQQYWPIKIAGGFPCITEDLKWTKNLYVVGGLASMNTGPDSANLMGIRRSASVVANALECRCWLRNDSNVLSNSFGLFWDDDSSDSDEE